MLATIILSTLFLFSHFVFFFFLDVIYFGNDINKTCCLYYTSVLKKILSSLSNNSPFYKIYPKEIIISRQRFLFKNICHNTIYNGEILKEIEVTKNREIMKLGYIHLML